MPLNTVGTKLSYKEGAMPDFVELLGLTEVGDVGGTPEKIEVTTLADTSKKYINGVIDYGDLTFTFNYDNSSGTANYRVLKELQDGNKVATYQIEYPDGTKHTFDAEVSCTIASAAVNGALTFTATMALQTSIVVTNPT